MSVAGAVSDRAQSVLSPAFQEKLSSLGDAQELCHR